MIATVLLADISTHHIITVCFSVVRTLTLLATLKYTVQHYEL